MPIRSPLAHLALLLAAAVLHGAAGLGSSVPASLLPHDESAPAAAAGGQRLLRGRTAGRRLSTSCKGGACIPTDMGEWNYTLPEPRSTVEAQVAREAGRFWTRSLLRAASVGAKGQAQLLPLLRRLREGQPITVVALGSSVVSGHAGCFSSNVEALMRMTPEYTVQCTTDTNVGNKHGYLSGFMEVINRTFPHPGHSLINVGWPARSLDSYTKQSCLEDYMPENADLVLLEQHETLPSDRNFHKQFQENFLASLERLLWRLQELLSRDGQQVPVVVLNMLNMELGSASNEKETIISCTHATPLGYAPHGYCHDLCLDRKYLEDFPVAPPKHLPASLAAELHLRPLSGWKPAGSKKKSRAQAPKPRKGLALAPFSSLAQPGALAEDALGPLLEHYGHAGVSLRDFLLASMRQGVLKQLNMTTPCQLAAAVLNDNIHPTPRVGRGLIADMLVEQLVMAQEQEAQDSSIRKLGQQMRYPSKPLVVPPGSIHQQHTMRCYRLQDQGSLEGGRAQAANKPAAKVVQSQGWEFVEYQVHGSERKYKPGWVASEPGSALVVELDSTFDTKATSQPVNLAVLYLKSYEHMGQARVSCESGCLCESVTLDALDKKEAVSITVDHVMQISQHAQCRIKFEVQPTSSGTEHKWKLVQINVASERINPRPPQRARRPH